MAKGNSVKPYLFILLEEFVNVRKLRFSTILLRWQLSSSNIKTNNFLYESPLMLTIQNYHIWVIKIQAHVKICSIWDTIKSKYNPPPLEYNPSIAQMKVYKDVKSTNQKLTHLFHSTLADVVFIRKIACETPKESWKNLKEKSDKSDEGCQNH